MISKYTKGFDRISMYILYIIGNFKNWAVFRTLITYNFFFFFLIKKKKITKNTNLFYFLKVIFTS